jgi:hypothetical protein
VDLNTLGLNYGGSDGLSYAIISDEGYVVSIIGGGALRGNIVYFQSSDCTCNPVDCSGGQAYVSGGQPGQLIRSTFSANPFDTSNTVFYTPKGASYADPVPGNLSNSSGSRRVTSSCQQNQSLNEGFPVIVNDPFVTGIDTGPSGVLDSTERHFVTFP